MKHKDPNLPVAPGNWADVKKTIPGLEAVAQQVQRGASQVSKLILTNIRVFSADADYKSSLQFLKRQGLRLLTLEETLFAVTQSPDFVSKLKAEKFYIGGKCTYKDGFYTIHRDLTLIEGNTSENPERNVLCTSGSAPMLFLVKADVYANAYNGRRFDLCADSSPADIVPVIVGFAQSMPLNSICEEVMRV